MYVNVIGLSRGCNCASFPLTLLTPGRFPEKRSWGRAPGICFVRRRGVSTSWNACLKRRSALRSMASCCLWSERTLWMMFKFFFTDSPEDGVTGTTFLLCWALVGSVLLVGVEFFFEFSFLLAWFFVSVAWCTIELSWVDPLDASDASVLLSASSVISDSEGSVESVEPAETCDSSPCTCWDEFSGTSSIISVVVDWLPASVLSAVSEASVVDASSSEISELIALSSAVSDAAWIWDSETSPFELSSQFASWKKC